MDAALRIPHMALRRSSFSRSSRPLHRSALLADDWPSWRGPDGTGVIGRNRTCPQQWSEASGVAWRAKLCRAPASRRRSSRGRHVYRDESDRRRHAAGRQPSVAGAGRRCGTSGERNLSGGSRVDATITIRADRVSLDRRQPRLAARTRAEGPLPDVHDKHNLSTPSPVTDGQTVIGWFGTGQVVALDAASGKLLWSKHLGKEYGAFEINWGHASSPALHGDLAIFPCYHETGPYLLALDKRTGAVRWKRDRQPGAHSYSTPLVVTHEGKATLVLNSSRGVEGFDPATGDAAVAGRRREPLSDSDAGAPSGRAVHEPRLSQQPVPRHPSRWHAATSASRMSSGRRRRARHTCRRLSTTTVCSTWPVRWASSGARSRHGTVGLARAHWRRLHRVAGRGRRQDLPGERNRRDDRPSRRPQARCPCAQQAQRASRRLASHLPRPPLPARRQRSHRCGEVRSRDLMIC